MRCFIPKCLFTFLLLLLTIVAVGCGQSTDNSDWEDLFDGQSLAGWRDYTGKDLSNWTVKDGMIIAASTRKGEIVTVGRYGDFELVFEWRLSEGGNSGVMYRIGDGAKRAGYSGPEYQLLDNDKAADNKIESHLTGSLYDLVAPSVSASRPIGSWNHSRIKVRDWKIIHWLNEIKVVELDLASRLGKERLSQSKFKDSPGFAQATSGYVALQNHGDPVSFRNIKIRRL